MEKKIKPDKRYFTKCLWILMTISGFVIITVAITHLAIYLAGGNPQAIKIIWPVGIGIVLVMWIIPYPIVRLWIRNLEYIIREDRITIHKGILTKTKQNIPLRSVTDFALSRTIYDRILGIGSIKIQTAGQSQSASGYEGYLSGLLDYESLHNELREKVRVLHPGSGALTTEEPLGESGDNLLGQILDELKKIRQGIERQ
ncbi:PH domain-containing protein [bacterium]|nr:PH domain-containing protein [bacterium]